MSKILNISTPPIIETESLGMSPGALAKRVFVKRLYQWCPTQNIEFDPWCDEEYPKTITCDNILDAKSSIKREFSKSPLVTSKNNNRFPLEVYYKLETFHPTGSFKERGAYYVLNKLSPEQKKLGVISASLGNWAMALAYWGKNLEIPVTVVLPVTASLRTQQFCMDYNAEVVVHGKDLTEAKRKAFAILVNSKFSYINGYDHPHVISAAGTIGVEILEQMPDVYAVLVPVGGGSLIAGIAAAIKRIRPGVLVYGIQSNKCPSFKRALEKGAPYQTALELGIATSLQVPTVGCNAFQTARNLVDDVVLISDDWISKAIFHLIDREKIVVEGAAAITLAAIMHLPKALRELREKKVVCVISGGNLEPMLFKCIERAKASDGRLVTIKATFPKEDLDTLKKIFNFITHLGCNIIRHDFDQSWLSDSYPNELNVTILCETRDKEHTKSVKRLLNKFFSDICEVQQERFCTSDMCKCFSCRIE
ncbi:PREDICTED: L-threonine dehydratase catabolic TdcB-like [Papilio polytes]|uniref:L-threonine dehydratase catabolic TdcB-like n=1 Tax=Papilio polytes TaxID=76194 RepID=UPI000675C234|nr:PREDICTED: L-threonine dehydratase catabolic TdcB-like [Papilio polytes]